MQFSPHFHRIIYIFIGGQIRGPCALRPTVMLRLESEQKTSKRNISSVYFFAMNIQSPPICVWNVKKLSVPSSCCCSFINAFFFLHSQSTPAWYEFAKHLHIGPSSRALLCSPIHTCFTICCCCCGFGFGLRFEALSLYVVMHVGYAKMPFSGAHCRNMRKLVSV